MAVLRNTVNESVLWANATTTFVIAGNTTVSNVCFTGSDGVAQNVVSGVIRKIMVATPNNTCSWVVSRGANMVFQCGGNFMFDFSGQNMMLNQDPTANIVCTMTGGGTIMLSISKEWKP